MNDIKLDEIKPDAKPEIKEQYLLKLLDKPRRYGLVTPEIRGVFKALGAQYFDKDKYWLVDAKLISGKDVLCLRWLVDLFLKSDDFESKFEVELWCIKDGKQELFRSFIAESLGNKYPDGRLVQVSDEVFGEITKSEKFVIEDDSLKIKR